LAGCIVVAADHNLRRQQRRGRGKDHSAAGVDAERVLLELFESGALEQPRPENLREFVGQELGFVDRFVPRQDPVLPQR